jgi:hypothetical protein
MSTRLTGISSMATKNLLAELATLYSSHADVQVAFESVGGVDAARRLQDGEAFDLVVLADDAIDKLVSLGVAPIPGAPAERSHSQTRSPSLRRAENSGTSARFQCCTSAVTGDSPPRGPET